MPRDQVLPLEIQLVLNCARTGHGAVTRARVASLLESELDWLRVVRFAVEHRVVPLLHRSLILLAPDAVPVDLMASLQSYSATVTHNNLKMAQALLQALEALACEGIQVMPYKGPVLALSGYRDLHLREFSDIDLVVDAHAVQAAREVLTRLGYREIRKRLTWETEFRGADTAIDLHWRIAPAQMEDYWIGFDFDLAGAFARRQSISILGRDVPCFDPEDALLVQCQTSLKNGFNRSLAQLRWVCDIAELIRAHPYLAWDILLTRATTARSRRALLLCLDLAHTLLDAPLPEAIAKTIRNDVVVTYLRRQLTYRYLTVESWKDRSLAAQFLYACLVQDNFAQSLPYLTRCLASLIKPNEQDRGFVRLPRRLDVLYYLVRPIRLCFTRVRKGSQAQ